MAINHGSLYTSLLALVLRALRNTHAEVNITGEGKGENRDGNGDGNGESEPAGAERGRERQKERLAQAGRAAGAGAKKRSLLVGYVQTYGAAYKWDGADKIRHL